MLTLKPLVRFLQKKIPPISQTEREAIEAGQVWWEKELFCGQPQWDKLLSSPKPVLTLEEQAFLDNQVEQLCGMLDDWEIVHNDHNMPENVWSFLKNEKFFGLNISKQFGGLGFSAIAQSSIITKIGTRSISAAVSTMVPNSLGPGELLLNYGTLEQQTRYLPRLASGEEIPCFALTAPDAGSDAGSITDTGIVCRDRYNNEDIIGIRLNWSKRYITLAPIATLIALAVHLYDPDHLLSDKEDIGITLCLIPSSHPGVKLGTRHYPMMQAFLNGPTHGENVFIPLDWIIGGVERAGQGWKMLMECLSSGRAISLPALSAASAKVAYRFTGAYAHLRRQFKLSISAFGGIKEALGYIAGYTYMLEACRLMTASAVDLQLKPPIASAIAKYHMTELSRMVIQHAMDIHGGHMIQMGPRNFLANIYIAIPISITVEGANILTRNLIIFGQGAIRCHPYLLQEIALLSQKEPDQNKLNRILLSHAGYSLRTLLRNVGYGLTGGNLISFLIKNNRIRKLGKQLTRMSSALALLSDVSIILLGGGLKRRERISARLGDILSQLYLASAVIKYYHDRQEPDTDIDNVCWAMQDCLYHIQIAIDEVLSNYPKAWIGKILSWIIFPYGRAYRRPSDKLHGNITKLMLIPSDFRDRISQYCYISHHEDDLTNRLERALANITQIEILRKKDPQTLSNDELHILAEFDTLIEEIIKVNEFSFDLSKVIA